MIAMDKLQVTALGDSLPCTVESLTRPTVTVWLIDWSAGVLAVLIGSC